MYIGLPIADLLCLVASALRMRLHAERAASDSEAAFIIDMITPSPPTKSSGFEVFDSSRLLILRGGNSHVR